jgi:uncharacterized protein (TIGR03083 family)
VDLTADQLFQIALDTAETDRAQLPAGLEQRLTGRVLAGTKPLQHPAWHEHGPQISSLAGFIETAAELAELIGALSPGEWAGETHLDGVTVYGLVTHLVGVERYVLGQLGRRSPLEAPRREDHWPVTRRATADLADRPSSFVALCWWQEVLAVIAACGALGPDHEVSYHHLTGSIRGLLVVRTFELWTHGDDIRRVTNRPLDELDEDRLSLMVNELMRILPLGLGLSGSPQPGRTAELNLTGRGGGRFEVALAPDSPVGSPDITLTVDSMDLCRWASNRLARDELDLLVEGDVSLLQPVLMGAAAFAAD